MEKTVNYQAVVSLLSCYSPHLYYGMNPSLRGTMPAKPGKMVSAQGVSDSKSQCVSKTTTRSIFLAR